MHQPSWHVELAQVLLSQRYASDERDLGWVQALKQLRAWLRDPRPYEAKHKRSWLTAIADFRHAVDGLGPAVRADVQAHLDELLNLLSALPAKDAAAQAAHADQLAGLLEACIADGLLLHSAWQDLTTAVRGNDADTVVTVRAQLLRNLLHSSHRDSALAHTMACILYGLPVNVYLAQFELGDVGPDDRPPPVSQADQTSTLTSEERSDLCVRLLSAPPRAAHHVVWHAFGRAAIRTMVEQVGPVTFYDSQWLVSSLTANGPHRDRLPTETAESDGFFPVEMLPQGRDVVIARVDLGVGPRADAPGDSRLLVQSLVLAATFPTDRHGWKLYEGHIHMSDHRNSDRVFRFADDDIDAQFLYGPLDVTAARFSEMAPRVAPHLSSTTTAELSEVIEAIGWWRASGVQPPDASVVVDVRILELLGSRVAGLGWPDYIEQFHKEAWIRSRVATELADLALHACADLQQFGAGVVDAVTALQRSFIRHGHRGSQVDLPTFISVLPELAALYPEHTLQRRRAAAAARRVQDAAGTGGWHGELEGVWSRSVERLRSVRNALAHGGPLTAAAAESVAPVAHQLAGTALLDSLTALVEGRSLVAEHTQRRDQERTWTTWWLAGAALKAFDGSR